LISSAFISLVENQLAPAWAVVIILGREFAVTGLRSVAATEGLIIPASKAGKIKMFSQVVTVALLIFSSVKGGPPTATRAFPVFAFWTVPEMSVALNHLSGNGTFRFRDLQMILYGLGRGMLWLVVISSCWSMYGYFRHFYLEARARFSAEEKKKQAVTPLTTESR